MTQPAVATEPVADAIRKELTTKLAWAVGTTLHVRYSGDCPIRDWAVALSHRIYMRHLGLTEEKQQVRATPKRGRKPFS